LITKKTQIMKKYWQAIGIAALATGILYYPAMKLYKYLKDRTKEDAEYDGTDHQMKTFFSPAYRNRHKPHHRSAHNGHATHGHESHGQA
jgi:hypothetical protein